MDMLTLSKFDSANWDRIKQTSGSWWSRQLDRPLIQIRLHNAPPERVKPALPYYYFQSFYDHSTPVESIIDVWDYDLSCTRYLGDAFPCVFPNFGPGVVAAFMGCRLENGNGTAWFHPAEKSPDESIQFYDDNIWYTRVAQLMSAADNHWQGHVQIGMTDIGGNIDVVNSFIPSQQLLLELYDNPVRVKQLTWQAHAAWWQYFERLNTLLPANPGYSSWCPLFSTTPFYMLQCDFSYMIGPDMFDEFVKPELAASCKKLANPFYHLDGPGQLPHLDSILSIPELKGIQWVPGAGNPSQRQWPEVYKTIYDAGKLAQIYEENGLDVLDTIADQTGDASALVLIADLDYSRLDEAMAFTKKWIG